MASPGFPRVFTEKAGLEIIFTLFHSVNKSRLNGFHLFCKETAQIDGMKGLVSNEILMPCLWGRKTRKHLGSNTSIKVKLLP